MDHFQLFQSPVAAAREWWYNSVWKEDLDEDEDDEMEERLKDTDDTSSQYSENVVVLKVGIHCEECKRIVGDALWAMQGVDRVDVDKLRQKVTVTGKVSTKRVLRTVKRTGKRVELWKIGSDSKQREASSSEASTARGAMAASIGDDGTINNDEEEEALCTIM